MARRKNMKRRRVILGNTFRLIRQNGMANVSLQMIAKRSGISKSLLQSYYPRKSKLITDIVSNLFTTLDHDVDQYKNIRNSSPFARMKAFIYTIGTLGMHDEGIDRIISEAFINNETLDNWSDMLFGWLDNYHLFDHVKGTQTQLKSGICFVTTGTGRLYYERKRFHLTAEQLSNYATSSLMFSFFNYNVQEVEAALKAGHVLIESADMETVHRSINNMFNEDKKIIG